MVPRFESFAHPSPSLPSQLSPLLLHPHGYNADGSSIAIERLRDAASRPQRSPSHLNPDSGAARRAAADPSLGVTVGFQYPPEIHRRFLGTAASYRRTRHSPRAAVGCARKQ